MKLIFTKTRKKTTNRPCTCPVLVHFAVGLILFLVSMPLL
jgi:hypothetical protein